MLFAKYHSKQFRSLEKSRTANHVLIKDNILFSSVWYHFIFGMSTPNLMFQLFFIFKFLEKSVDFAHSVV